MPPKATVRSQSKGAKPDGKTKKVTAQQQAMEDATALAQKLYKQHEQLRVESEQVDRVQRDRVMLEGTLEKERLREEKIAFLKTQREFVDQEKLAFQEHDKHTRWAHVPDATRLPDVSSQREINTFLSVWRDQERSYDAVHDSDAVIAGAPANIGGTHPLFFIRGEQGMPANKRRRLVDEELEMCLQAVELMRAIQLARDRCTAAAAIAGYAHKEVRESAHSTVKTASPKGQSTGGVDGRSCLDLLRFHDENMQNVSQQIQAALDFATVNAIMYYDVVLDGSDAERESLTRVLPDGQPVFKYGLWVKVKEATRSFTSLVFPDIDVRLDPKSSALPKLPKALGLSRENVGIRALQFSFNPFAGHDMRGKEYYALDCTLKVDLLGFSHRPHEFGEWQLRSETEETHQLQCQEYPPRTAESRVEDPGFRISLDLPHTLVIRQPSLLVGKWVPATCEWEPCSHVVFGASLGGGGGAGRADANARRATFTTSELAHFAVLQETVFDAPYEHWSVRPVSYDQVVVTLEGRRRGDTSDRVFRILVEDAECKLLSPDDGELQPLREGWCAPATLFRALAQAGFNFVLDDEDAKYLSNVLPKSAALEAKAYADIAQVSQFYTVSSTRHNKYGEDADLALFRLSTHSRGVDEELNPYDNTELPSEHWRHIRYHLRSCVLSAFTDDQDTPDLNVLRGHDSHFNLHALLQALEGEDAMRTQLVNTNYLLRRCVLEILHLARPLSWG